ncbi:MAG: DUF2064 domain-containing protein [Myxococcales bacterium]|nr:DUF2064 domain-containing protein [Myxococcales bacterium]
MGRTIGADAAAHVARAMLRDTYEAISATPLVQPVLATTDPTADHGLSAGVAAWDQGTGDLGQRVERMLRRALTLAPAAIAVGADAPIVSIDTYQLAVRSLGAKAAVLGRTEDGGFYALGVRRCPLGLLADLPWSQPSTWGATRIRLVTHGLSPAELPEHFDVDELADLERLKSLLQPGQAPHTSALLEQLEWP